MLGMFLNARRKSSRLVSALALGVGLAGGAVVGTAVTSAPALAQRQAAPKFSDNFAKVYQPVATIANAPAGDFASAKGQIPGMIAAATTPDDRFAAGNVTLLIGTKTEDAALQRQGLELMVASGKADPAQVGQLNYFIGQLAYNAKDYAAARTALQAAVAAGYTQDNPEALIAESYFGAGQNAEGLNYLKGVVDARMAAGQPVPDAWLRRGLSVAYSGKLTDQANEWSALLTKAYPTAQNWQAALQVVNALNNLDPQVQLDLLRLMSLTDALSERTDFVRYIEAADPRIMSNEVAKVLDAGVAKGVFTTTDNYYVEVKRVVDDRAAADRSEAPKLAAEGRSGSGSDALNAGDVLYSLGDFAQAEEMYQLAVQKGGVDKDRALTRLGIAQAQQNKLDAAKATFAQVSGARAPVARMWNAYIESKA